jgi:hypothetical protein
MEIELIMALFSNGWKYETFQDYLGSFSICWCILYAVFMDAAIDRRMNL